MDISIDTSQPLEDLYRQSLKLNIELFELLNKQFEYKKNLEKSIDEVTKSFQDLSNNIPKTPRERQRWLEALSNLPDQFNSITSLRTNETANGTTNETTTSTSNESNTTTDQTSNNQPGFISRTFNWINDNANRFNNDLNQLRQQNQAARHDDYITSNTLSSLIIDSLPIIIICLEFKYNSTLEQTIHCMVDPYYVGIAVDIVMKGLITIGFDHQFSRITSGFLNNHNKINILFTIIRVAIRCFIITKIVQIYGEEDTPGDVLNKILEKANEIDFFDKYYLYIMFVPMGISHFITRMLN
ncbi:hypothetical protein BN7_5662 [Wickerhamomyces ciferrii]|uniref:Uncharacterized protein n=1 Tax=Wickerhamomyces ciferrii (strain ATCC 14091 / BCRC 22168 / CBS 111 / JCM 3599 / NBRC 0793 / NRRL Y-1031 F-60-10) TaxID=1206466 RepID=K0KX64_WICCF|nr:uncharacterized protein BN7_5662 [Wickerhamomyces ciferrii]CCH46074.1 hypothetical protein BN7_5662 [Wickerhamomyces ciferrii]